MFRRKTRCELEHAVWSIPDKVKVTAAYALYT